MFEQAFLAVIYYVGIPLLIVQLINYAVIGVEAFRLYIKDEYSSSSKIFDFLLVIFGQFWIIILLYWICEKRYQKQGFWSYIKDAMNAEATESSPMSSILGLACITSAFLLICLLTLAGIAGIIAFVVTSSLGDILLMATTLLICGLVYLVACCARRLRDQARTIKNLSKINEDRMDSLKANKLEMDRNYDWITTLSAELADTQVELEKAKKPKPVPMKRCSRRKAINPSSKRRRQS